MGEEGTEIDHALHLPPEDREELDPADLPPVDDAQELPADEPVDPAQVGNDGD